MGAQLFGQWGRAPGPEACERPEVARPKRPANASDRLVPGYTD